MIYTIRPLKDEEYAQMAQIQLSAYPASTGTAAEIGERMKKQSELETVTVYGVFDHDSMVGGFVLYDYDMNIHGKTVAASGIGSVAVDLCRKKEKVAREIVKFYLYNARANSRPMALLYPFNPEFYKNMGFGFGCTLSQFRIKPGDLPRKSGKTHVRRLDAGDAGLMCDFYNAQARKTHGLIQKDVSAFEASLKREQARVFGCVKDGRLTAYLISSFKKGDESFLVNDLIISELLFEDVGSLHELLAFLHSQSDQIRNIVFNMFDEDFLFALKDPRNQSQRLLFSVYHEYVHKGLGLMYRITDMRAFLEAVADRYRGDFVLKLDIADDFVSENEASYFVDFRTGTLRAECGYDVELKLKISEASSLAMCAARLNKLIRYGLAEISDAEYVEKLDKAFAVSEKPVCLTFF